MSETVPETSDRLPAGTKATKLGLFIQTYHAFLSSFVIGVAGLIATSVWQYRQSEIAVGQARSQQLIATTKADNDWRIARAEILSKNLGVLATQGPGTADQRFGVLLSLTRGTIIDPELAVAYALELGRDNPTYMQTVLMNTANKNYSQLAQAFRVTCLQRFGVQRAAPICKDDALAERSAAIAQLTQEELDAAPSGELSGGPMTLLQDERQVQAAPGRLSWLFTPYLQSLYDARKWKEITRFESFAPGARLVAALVLAATITDSLVSPTESGVLERFRAEGRKWLVSYLFSPSCDPGCRARLVDVMLSAYFEAQGDYDEPIQRLLLESRNEAPTLSTLHTRLLWCQVDGDDLARFRDWALVPAVTKVLSNPKADLTSIGDLVGLMALVPDPPSADAKAYAAWASVQASLALRAGEFRRILDSRRAAAARERLRPAATLRMANFCNARELGTAVP